MLAIDLNMVKTDYVRLSGKKITYGPYCAQICPEMSKTRHIITFTVSQDIYTMKV